MLNNLLPKLKIMAFGQPSPSYDLAPQTFVKIPVVYPINVNRPDSVFKEWNVAVKTAQPDVRIDNHSSWMAHIMIEHMITLGNVADLEIYELRSAILDYTKTDVGIPLFIKLKDLKSHES